jgi:cell division protein FtsZ
MSDQRFSVMGMGGAGSRLMGAVAALVDTDLPLLAVDSDTCSLAESKAPACLQVGEAITEGFGTGGDDRMGRQAMDAGVTELLEAAQDIAAVLIVTGLGGGMGSGGSVSAVQALQDAGIMTICFATLPFAFEGGSRRAVANRAIEELDAACDVLITVPNDALFEEVSAGDLPALFAAADKKLGAAVLALWQTLSKPGCINVDFADFRRIGEDTEGACVLAYAEAAGEERAAAVLKDVLDGPGLEGGKQLSRARLVLVSLVVGPDVTLKEVGEVLGGISKAVKPECRVCVGTSVDDAWVGRLSVSLIVGEKRATSSDLTAPHVEGSPVAVDMPKRQNAHDRGRAPARSVSGARKKSQQPSLPLDRGGRGRFKDVAPTILNGEDLDVPTFIRRRIRVDK